MENILSMIIALFALNQEEKKKEEANGYQFEPYEYVPNTTVNDYSRYAYDSQTYGADYARIAANNGLYS